MLLVRGRRSATELYSQPGVNFLHKTWRNELLSHSLFRKMLKCQQFRRIPPNMCNTLKKTVPAKPLFSSPLDSSFLAFVLIVDSAPAGAT